jgi:hypothetical protein
MICTAHIKGSKTHDVSRGSHMDNAPQQKLRFTVKDAETENRCQSRRAVKLRDRA